MTLLACPTCSELTDGPGACAHCGAPVRGRARVSPVVAALLGLSFTGCIVPAAKYGVPDTGYVDDDQDGYTVRDGDCDDDDPEIHPGAVEIAGDGVDQDCDGADDP